MSNFKFYSLSFVLLAIWLGSHMLYLKYQGQQNNTNASSSVAPANNFNEDKLYVVESRTVTDKKESALASINKQ